LCDLFDAQDNRRVRQPFGRSNLVVEALLFQDPAVEEFERAVEAAPLTLCPKSCSLAS
jgi:hypothetical protein